ncbi:MAG: hypothetical protein HY236_16615 [Acidobacteria bacterium]|nr:hypothetical protein [Acidobacteriota bacterium]
MLMTLLILVVSSALFLYWFRYTVILILRTRPAPDYAPQVAVANHLSFVEIRQKLHAPVETESLGSFCKALQQDYRMLKYLLGHAATGQAGRYTVEQRLLMANFRVLALCCAMVQRFQPNAAKTALLEMSSILEYFANVMGSRVAALAGEAARA